VENNFFFVCSHNYDKQIYIISNLDNIEDMKIPKLIEPGKIKILDLQQENLNHQGFG